MIYQKEAYCSYVSRICKTYTKKRLVRELQVHPSQTGEEPILASAKIGFLIEISTFLPSNKISEQSNFKTCCFLSLFRKFHI